MNETIRRTIIIISVLLLGISLVLLSTLLLKFLSKPWVLLILTPLCFTIITLVIKNAGARSVKDNDQLQPFDVKLSSQQHLGKNQARIPKFFISINYGPLERFELKLQYKISDQGSDRPGLLSIFRTVSLQIVAFWWH